IAASWKEENRLAKPGVVVTVMSNLGLERYLGSLGLLVVRTAVGDRAGRLVVRASGTEPVIRVMAEGDDAELVTNVVDELVAALGKTAA
ncbi:MAG: hypothetical protein K8F58_13230, partial [Bauldia sp.]|nr:hypothetical protein [Bauldia sp.]